MSTGPPFSLSQREGPPLMRRPSADAVAGNGRPLSWAPSADAVSGGGNKITAQSGQAHVLHDTPRSSPSPGPYDVEITTGVTPDAMTRAEARVSPLRQTLAFQ